MEQHTFDTLEAAARYEAGSLADARDLYVPIYEFTTQAPHAKRIWAMVDNTAHCDGCGAEGVFGVHLTNSVATDFYRDGAGAIDSMGSRDLDGWYCSECSGDDNLVPLANAAEIRALEGEVVA
jgi:hypothetical protein